MLKFARKKKCGDILKIKVIMICALAVSLLVMALPQAFAHSKVVTGNDECVLLPNSYHGELARGQSAIGIATARAAGAQDAGAISGGSCGGNEINKFPNPQGL